MIGGDKMGREMVRRMRGTRNAWLIMGVSLIALGLMVSLSSSIFDYTMSFSEYGGVILQSNDEVNVSNSKVLMAGSEIEAAGLEAASPVVMASTSPLPLASTGLPKGYWYYRVDIYSISGKTPANQVFKVELYRWSPTSKDYTLQGTLYIKSTASPDDNQGVRLYFNLGSSKPASSEAFMVVVSRV
jgi:hypothetical protein